MSEARRRAARRRWTRVAGLAAMMLLAGWAGGFLYFLRLTREPDPPLPPHADGIVALTGGPGRVELALRLLREGRADLLLITGIGGGTDLATLGRIAGVETTDLSSRITLGRYAASTRGNGLETASWAEQNRIRSLIVVTATYHMPRALVELHQALPSVHLLPMPVRQHPAADEGGGETGSRLRLEVSEYVKYLLTVTGMAAWLPLRETQAAVAAAGGHA